MDTITNNKKKKMKHNSDGLSRRIIQNKNKVAGSGLKG